jgi:hypothetical protein
MVSLASSGPSPTTPNLAPYLWDSAATSTRRCSQMSCLSWNFWRGFGHARADKLRPMFGNRNSPHSDRLRVRTILSILKNGSPFYTDIDESFVDWAAGDGTFSKTVGSVGDSYTLNIGSDPRQHDSTTSRCACRSSTMASTITSGATRARSRCTTKWSTIRTSQCWCLSLRAWLRSARALVGLAGSASAQEVSGSYPHPQPLSHSVGEGCLFALTPNPSPTVWARGVPLFEASASAAGAQAEAALSTRCKCGARGV